MKLIDKDKVVAEIDRLYEEEGSFYASDVLCELEVFIDALEEEPVSEDLEEIEKEYNSYMEKHNGVWVDTDYIQFARHFANWQKEQMMKAAFDAEVGYWNIRGLSLNVRLKGDIKDGDRVKLIMIKEE